MISLKYLKLNYILLFLVIIWDPLRSYLLNFQGVGYIYLGATFLGVLYELRKLNFVLDIFKKPIIFWFLWCVYALLNTFVLHRYHAQSAFNFAYVTILPLFIVLMVTRKNYPLPTLINVFIVAFVVRILFSLFFDSFARLGKDDVSRLGESFNANAIAFGGFFLLVCLALKRLYTKKLKLYEWGMALLGFYIVFATSSRKTIIAIFILLIGYMYIYRSLNVIKRYFGLLLASIVILVVGFVLINRTNVGQRIMNSYDKTINASSPEKMFDSRAGQYIQGYHQFVDNPLTGVGLYNFGYVGPVKITAHSEYIVQLAESGIIGFALFVMFYFKIFKMLKKSRLLSNLDRQVSEFFIFFLIAAFVLMSGAWVYNLSVYWIIMGILIKYLNYNKKYIDRI